MSLKKWKNPFYTLLIPVGMAFVVTVFAYGYMAFVEVNATNPEVREQTKQPLFTWLNKNGTQLILWELGVLGVLTVGAIATDSWWMSDSRRETADGPQTQLDEFSTQPKILTIDSVRQVLLVFGIILLMSGMIVYGARNTDGTRTNASASIWIVILGGLIIGISLILRKYQSRT